MELILSGSLISMSQFQNSKGSRMTIFDRIHMKASLNNFHTSSGILHTISDLFRLVRSFNIPCRIQVSYMRVQTRESLDMNDRTLKTESA